MDELGKKLLEQTKTAIDTWFDGHDGCEIEHNGQMLYGYTRDEPGDLVDVVDADMTVVATYKITLEKV
jgi:hypothetical protein